MFGKIIRFVASGFGLGYMPVAPGTFGTVLGSVLFYFFRHESHSWFLKFVALFAVAAVVVAHFAENNFKEKDSQKIVIDEVAGVLCCYAFVTFSIYSLVLGFVLFRLFDVAKIFPANTVQDKLPGGLGVVGDDLVAGLQAGVLLHYLPQIYSWVGFLLK